MTLLIVLLATIIVIIFVVILYPPISSRVAYWLLRHHKQAKHPTVEKEDALAAQKERERLARDSYDKVLQVLFSANAVAQALPQILDRKPEKAHTYLQDLRQFTQSAMANMRPLLVELHPESLEKTELTILIKQLGAAFEGNHNINITYTFIDKMLLPSDYQIAIYRIVQEALNNVATHANASNVEIQLQYIDEAIELIIRDDGNSLATSPQSSEFDLLRLNIMREYAQDINAHLEITSQPSQGTEIILRGSIQ